jgi:hypothetical protein
MEGRIGNNAVDAASRKCLLLHEQNLLLARNSSPLFFFFPDLPEVSGGLECLVPEFKRGVIVGVEVL